MRLAVVLVRPGRLWRFEPHLAGLIPLELFRESLGSGKCEVVGQTTILVLDHDAHALAGLDVDHGVRRREIVLEVKRHSLDDQRDLSCWRAAQRRQQGKHKHHHRQSGDRLCRNPMTQNAHPTSIPVTYITAKPANRPARAGPLASARTTDPSCVMCRTICPITCAMAPTPTARKSTDHTGE